MERKLIFEKSFSGRKASYLKKPKIPLKDSTHFIPEKFLRKEINLPSLGELEVVRHYTRLSQLNYSVDTNFYPLGSCTMKYNPKLNEDLAGLEEFVQLHPYQSQKDLQGAFELIYNLEKLLCKITGMARFTFQPSAGAHGEFTGLLIVDAYHKSLGRKRKKIIIPDSAHGTNPATASMCGFEVISLPSDRDGLVDIERLKKVVDSQTAAMMLTCPNTLGLFEERILEISEFLHKNGALFYYDGANFNALLGITTPFLMGFDIIHLNFHKTFSAPHGSGGPGAGAVGVIEKLVEFLPVPLIDRGENGFYLNYHLRHSIGRVRTFLGNFSVLVKAYAYLLRLGERGLRRVAENCVLNANYLRKKLESFYEVPFNKPCMHEVVFSCKKQKVFGISALDIAKRLIDYGIHPPTMYFPLIVKEALMVEPTETEGKEELDYFIEVMKRIFQEIKDNPQLLKNAPHTRWVKRVDEVNAARNPVLKWAGYGA